MKNYRNKGLVGATLEIKNNNYGSMLQSYATQVMMKNYGVNFELITYKKKYTPLMVLTSIPRIFNKVTMQDKLASKEKQRFMKAYPETKESLKKRTVAFDNFRAKYFTEPERVFYGYKELKKGSKQYRAFVTGSDQLWSPSGLASNFYNLNFTYDEAVRISYASSFGVKDIPWYQKRRTKNYLNRVQYVSCRENSGRDIVKCLTGREVPVVADPTMLFSGEEWEQMLPCDRLIQEPYIFSYCLGTDFDVRRKIKELSEKTGLKIVVIRQFVKADLGFGDISIEDAGPAEFVNLIKNAEYVCTDSFHGSVFSTLLHKKFIVFNRYSEENKASKNTRIESLCNNLGLNERRFCDDIYAQMIQPIDYSAIDEKYSQIRKKSFDYLEKAFDSI